MNWYTLCGPGTSLIRYTKGILESIKDFKISCCKAISHKKYKLGCWVSESYLAMARLKNDFTAIYFT